VIAEQADEAIETRVELKRGAVGDRCMFSCHHVGRFWSAHLAAYPRGCLSKILSCSNDYENVLSRVGLQEEAHNKKLKGFSKGMRQKCGIAIAILKDAPAILLDEPTSGLDPKAGREFMSILGSLRDEGKAILMSTHDIFRAKELADIV
jgi:ABC-type Mn2+/Zn2+ transport system ATPase subunit